MKLIMTLLVRDEADIIAQNLDFHLAQGVDHVVVIDNGSVDGTRDILAEREREGPVTVLDEPAQDFSQGEWMTRAAVIARDQLGADWVLHNDADEFWLSPTGALKDQLRATSADALYCPRLNLSFAWDDPSDAPWTERCIYRALSPIPVPQLQDRMADPLPCPYFFLALPGKVVTRMTRFERIGQGNHNAFFEGEGRTEPGTIEVFHAPIRSVAQFRSKIVNGGEAYARNAALPPIVGWHRRRWFRMLEEGLERALGDALPDMDYVERGLANGTLVRDTRLADALRRFC